MVIIVQPVPPKYQYYYYLVIRFIHGGSRINILIVGPTF